MSEASRPAESKDPYSDEIPDFRCELGALCGKAHFSLEFLLVPLGSNHR